MDAALDEMSAGDIGKAARLIRVAMNDDEAAWADKTVRFHFACKTHGLSDGRSYYVLRGGTNIVAIAGLHCYIWGPPSNVWLAWFAVHPDHQGRGLGSELIRKMEQIARERGHTRLFVETYGQPDFQKAVEFYRARGFEPCGQVDDYLSDGSPMIVLSKKLG